MNRIQLYEFVPKRLSSGARTTARASRVLLRTAGRDVDYSRLKRRPTVVHDRALLWNFRPLATLIAPRGCTVNYRRAHPRPSARRIADFSIEASRRATQIICSSASARLCSLFAENLNTIKSGGRVLHAATLPHHVIRLCPFIKAVLSLASEK